MNRMPTEKEQLLINDNGPAKECMRICSCENCKYMRSMLKIMKECGITKDDVMDCAAFGIEELQDI